MQVSTLKSFTGFAHTSHLNPWYEVSDLCLYQVRKRYLRPNGFSLVFINVSGTTTYQLVHLFPPDVTKCKMMVVNHREETEIDTVLFFRTYTKLAMLKFLYCFIVKSKIMQAKCLLPSRVKII